MSNRCLAHIRIATKEKSIEGTENEMLNHSTALGLNQISSIDGNGPMKTDYQYGKRQEKRETDIRRRRWGGG